MRPLLLGWTSPSDALILNDPGCERIVFHRRPSPQRAVLDPNPADPDDAGARACNAAAAAHPNLQSIVLPMFKDKIDGMAISRVKALKHRITHRMR